jgi:hypothetical protein
MDGDDLTAEKVTNPAHGVLTLAANGSFSYTPAAGYVGPDAFSYRATDGSLDSPTRAVTLTVTALPPSPTPASTVPPPSGEPTAIPTSQPSAIETLPGETDEPFPSPDPELTGAPSAAASSGEPLPSPSPIPSSAAGDEGGVSLPILLTLVLLGVLLAFGAAIYVPRWLEAQRGAASPMDRDR